VQFELGYWPKMLDADDLLIDVTTGKIYDYNTIKLLPLLPGEGAVFFVGSAEEWKLEKEKVFEGGVL